MRLLFLCFLFVLRIDAAAGREQSITVVGELICDRKFVGGEVELWEHDFFDFDDLLNGTKADGGRFLLFGRENEFFAITPYVQIKHTCDVRDSRLCYRLTEFEIPQSKIDGLYDMSIVSLNVRPQNDEEYCDD
ncbi:hypothetical protein M3Y99_01331900 [Aphelenchoides fujianensis]|nr:hypothetical protein M3Y99_01331900 [Aphelenchoides fujianensis]